MVRLAVCLASAAKFEALERALIDPADTLRHQKTFNRIVNPMAKAEIITSHSFRVSFLTKWLGEMVRLAVKRREGLSIWPTPFELVIRKTFTTFGKTFTQR